MWYKVIAVCPRAIVFQSFPNCPRRNVTQAILWKLWKYAFIVLGPMRLHSYLAIRSRLNRKVPAIEAAHMRQNAPQQNAKLSRTLFVVITASLLFWLPSIIVKCVYFLCSDCVPLILFHIFNIFRLANSLVNPIIYSLKNLALCSEKHLNDWSSVRSQNSTQLIIHLESFDKTCLNTGKKMGTFWRCCFYLFIFFCEKGREKTKKRTPFICLQMLNFNFLTFIKPERSNCLFFSEKNVCLAFCYFIFIL